MGTEKPKPRAQGSHLGKWAQALAGQLKVSRSPEEGLQRTAKPDVDGPGLSIHL